MINLEFDPESHSYTLNGALVPSVTEVLSSEGLNSFEWCTERDKARGSAVHKIAELLAGSPIKGTTVDEIISNSRWAPEETAPALVGYGRAAVLYLMESGIKPVLVEARVGSARLNLAGTLDLYGIMPDKDRRLIDFKSGQPREAANVQTALYAELLKETLGQETDSRVVVWLKPDGTYRSFAPRPAGGMDLYIGMDAVALYHWRRKYKQL
jgi:PD-(D/E)XK nuclease superfamily